MNPTSRRIGLLAALAACVAFSSVALADGGHGHARGNGGGGGDHRMFNGGGSFRGNGGAQRSGSEPRSGSSFRSERSVGEAPRMRGGGMAPGGGYGYGRPSQGYSGGVQFAPGRRTPLPGAVVGGSGGYRSPPSSFNGNGTPSGARGGYDGRTQWSGGYRNGGQSGRNGGYRNGERPGSSSGDFRGVRPGWHGRDANAPQSGWNGGGSSSGIRPGFGSGGQTGIAPGARFNGGRGDADRGRVDGGRRSFTPGNEYRSPGGSRSSFYSRPGYDGRYDSPSGSWHSGGYGHSPRWNGGYWRGRYWPRAYYSDNYVRFWPVLPALYSTFWFGGISYYYVDDLYYTWSPERYGYIVTSPPPIADSEPADSVEEPAAQVEDADSSGSASIYVYPRNGQSEEQTANDRYECHQWAVSQTGFDPTGSNAQSPATAGPDDYQRALIACLDARGYTAK